MMERKSAEQRYDAQRTEQTAGDNGGDSAAAAADQEDRLLFANDCRSYFMFRLADEPASSLAEG